MKNGLSIGVITLVCILLISLISIYLFDNRAKLLDNGEGEYRVVGKYSRDHVYNTKHGKRISDSSRDYYIVIQDKKDEVLGVVIELEVSQQEYSMYEIDGNTLDGKYTIDVKKCKEEEGLFSNIKCVQQVKIAGKYYNYHIYDVNIGTYDRNITGKWLDKNYRKGG